ncbi:helix-turn-helix transcriptional regulator [Lysinibacillus xylanilyticus]|uniref:helix-turn-helix domain-containing protein n=1 Tax=Lysinibacillus xylanilyticus TaxID=582475 RepID=UPI002B24DA5A|nr:helix-turn-helix transcriptional regulator [Lysinibacillus xylanilyticus]MEB2279263.1 helix-turn-helix transcriptional regulator [Lysinibacillus xylanilyticus]
MIRNRLAALMAERRLKITRVAKDTGISRNTITSISQNDSEMFRMETINNLCKYLGVTPCEFFDYEPIDIEFTYFLNELHFDYTHGLTNSKVEFEILLVDIDILMDVYKNNNNQARTFDLNCFLHEEPHDLTDFYDLTVDFENNDAKNTFVTEIYEKINPAFHQDIYTKLFIELSNEIRKYLVENFENNSQPNSNSKEDFLQVVNNLYLGQIHSDVFKKF